MSERVRVVVEMDLQPTIADPSLQRPIVTVTPEMVRADIESVVMRRFGMHRPIDVRVGFDGGAS